MLLKILDKEFKIQIIKTKLMKNIIILTLLLFAINIHSQNTASFKIADKGRIEKILPTADGYVTIYVDSANHPNIIKWDNYFNPIWKISFIDSSIFPWGRQIIEVADGSFYYAPTTVENLYWSSIVITKISGNGSILWNKKYYWNTALLKGIPVIANACSGENGFIFSAGMCGTEGTMIRADENGNILWCKQYYYQNLNTFAISIFPENNGYAILSRYNKGSHKLAHLFYRIDDSGNIIPSHKSYVNDSLDIFYYKNIVKLNNGKGFACTGGIPNPSVKSQAITFLDTAFNITKSILLMQDSVQFNINDLVSTPSGNAFIACGTIWGHTHFEGCLLKVNINGTVEWCHKTVPYTNNIGNGKDAEFLDMIMKNNYLYVGGFGNFDGAIIAILDSNATGFCNSTSYPLTVSNRTYDSDDSLITNTIRNSGVLNINLNTSNFVFINKHQYCGVMPGFEKQELILNSLLIYPNPANEYIEFSNENILDDAYKISIYNSIGQLIKTYNEINKQLYIGDLRNGVYMIEIFNKNSKFVRKLIKY